jgi:diguanylate cyclase (GGDEF)-like protein
LALHDALTGLATRLLLRDRLDTAVDAARRRQTGLALLMVDLDKFKDINDTFGHHAGDEVLRVTADRLLAAVRKADTVARFGGDEFVVLLADLLDTANC